MGLYGRMVWGRSTVFVSEASLRAPVVHYIAPHWDDVPELIAGLEQFSAKTAGAKADSIARAAVLSFGFVYIHPLADGNGRISRFLINDRSEEHTSELQSLMRISYAVFCLKKKKNKLR